MEGPCFATGTSSLCTLALACQPAGEQGAEQAVDTAAEEETIHELNRQWVQAVAEGDVDFIADSIYAENGALMPPNAPLMRGEQMRGMWTQLTQLPGFDLNFSADEIHFSDDGSMAYDIGSYSLAYEGPDGPVEDRGKYLVVWERRDGARKVAADMFGSNNPPPGS